jgi:hypothetical protein
MAKKTELPPEAKGKRISRRQAMDRVQERTGRTMSETTFVYGWRVPYYVDGRQATYLLDVVDDHIDKHLARVSQQVHCYEGFPRSKPPVNRVAKQRSCSAANEDSHKSAVKGCATALVEQL